MPVMREKALLPQSQWNAFVQPIRTKLTDGGLTGIRIFHSWTHINAYVESRGDKAAREQARAHLEQWAAYRVDAQKGRTTIWNMAEFAETAEDNDWDKEVNAFLNRITDEGARPGIKTTLAAF